MKMRIALAGFLLFAVIAGVAVTSTGLVERNVGAQEAISDASAEGGEFKFAPKDEITDDERESIKREIEASIVRLESEGKLPAVRPDLVQLSSPLRPAAGSSVFNVEAISNYVDHNALFPSQYRDWNCGVRTYDQASGYNHAGIDYFTWPFSWKMMDDNTAEIVAAAAGTIVFKSDGRFDRSCGFNNNQWNAVYVRHSDNSIAWYGHMKNGTVTSKGVGATVVAGEKLGIVGSSGNSTGPHLHFELYNALNQLQDPFQGTCNLMNVTSWWAQQESYRVTRLNALRTHSAMPTFPTCPTTEVTNEKTTFRPGEQLYAVAFFRDQIANQQTQYSIIRPNETVFDSWAHASNTTFNASYWGFPRTLPADAPNGSWKLRAIVSGTTFETNFTVSSAVTVGGRVTTPTGQGLRNAVVSLIDAAGTRRTATTSSFGIYSFADVNGAAGTYTMTVASKRYRFSPRIQSFSSNVGNLDFAGLE